MQFMNQRPKVSAKLVRVTIFNEVDTKKNFNAKFIQPLLFGAQKPASVQVSCPPVQSLRARLLLPPSLMIRCASCMFPEYEVSEWPFLNDVSSICWILTLSPCKNIHATSLPMARIWDFTADVICAWPLPE